MLPFCSASFSLCGRVAHRPAAGLPSNFDPHLTCIARTISTSAMRLSDGSTLALVALTAIVAAWPTTTRAQPGDFARSLAAEVGVTGDFGEPLHDTHFADNCRCRLRPQDEVWVISSRHLGWPCDEDAAQPALKYWRWDCDKHNWRKTPASRFYESDSATVVTFFYIHGNRVDSWKAVDLGWYTYDSIVRSGDDPRPVRYVIWSWPSTEVQGQMKDVRFKAARTDAEGYYLGWVMSQIREDVPISLMGFSFGARVITGGMHVAAGGELGGQQLGHAQPRPGRVRCVLMAGALHNYWLAPDCYHGRATQVSDQMLILANSCDKILRKYHWVFKGEDPAALGVTGSTWQGDTGRIAQLDCAPAVGETHDSLMYLDSPQLNHLARQYVLWRDVTTARRESAAVARQ